MIAYRCYRTSSCMECGFCERTVACPVGFSEDSCFGCMACYYACPNSAISYRIAEAEPCRIRVDGAEVEVPAGVPLKRALELLGYTLGSGLDGFCETGGCYSCLVKADGRYVRSCMTPVRGGMDVELGSIPLLRIVSGPQGHSVGGVGTPYWVKGRGWAVEVAIWAAGCNLRCPQCQNYHITYDSISKPSTPREAARAVSEARRYYGVDRMAISGGEPTLNFRWLLRYFRELREMNPSSDARIHLDTNATILTRRHIDLLVEAGMTDIGPDLKGARVETFMEITGIRDVELARRYLENSWSTVKYVVDEYQEKVFIGVGVPYNPVFMSLDELAEIGDRLASIDPGIQVCVLDYFPTFRRRDLKRPSVREMREARELLRSRGLKTVLAQTPAGHIGP